MILFAAEERGNARIVCSAVWGNRFRVCGWVDPRVSASVSGRSRRLLVENSLR